MVKRMIWGAVLALGLTGCGAGIHPTGSSNASSTVTASGSKTGVVASPKNTSAVRHADSIVIPANTKLPPAVQKNITAVLQQLNLELQQLKQEMGG